MGKRWTPEELEKLQELYEAGHQIPTIAEMMGKDKRQISNKVCKSGMGKRRTEMLAKAHKEVPKEKRKFTEGAKFALGYYHNCVI